ncbi:arginase family enzyme [Clostridium pascui]|nr:arginase family enzyme [Clostridium pascui]
MGIRGPRNNFNAIKEAKKYGASVITSFDVKKNGVDASVKKAIEIASKGTSAIYVSVCSDALDIAFNPGGPADLCGLTSFELAEMLYQCGLGGAKGFDFMEVYPPDDLHNVSSHGACWMAIYMMAGMAKRMLSEKM